MKSVPDLACKLERSSSEDLAQAGTQEVGLWCHPMAAEGAREMSAAALPAKIACITRTSCASKKWTGHCKSGLRIDGGRCKIWMGSYITI